MKFPMGVFCQGWSMRLLTYLPTQNRSAFLLLLFSHLEFLSLSFFISLHSCHSFNFASYSAYVGLMNILSLDILSVL